MEPSHLPSWYHGIVSRNEAEKSLLDGGGEPGLYLVRASSSGSGYVLSLCHEQDAVSHYFIRSESLQGVQYLTFDTDNGVAPRFHSLSSIIQYLYSNPAHLPVRLIKCLPKSHKNEDNHNEISEYDIPPFVPARTSLARSPSKQRMRSPPPPTANSEEDSNNLDIPMGFSGDGGLESDILSQTSNFDILGKDETFSNTHQSKIEEQQALHVSGSLLAIVKDSIRAASPSVSEEDLEEEKLYATAQRFSERLEMTPDLKVYSVPRGGLAKAVLGNIGKIQAGDNLKLLGVEEAEGGGVVILCEDSRGKTLKFPSSTDIRVLPSEFRAPSSSKTKSSTQNSMSKLLCAISDDEVTVMHNQRKANLADMVANLGGLNLSPVLMRSSHNFLRETIKEGYLSKLPPERNRVQTWHRRYFRLVLSLNRSLNGGPVYLEYYERHRSKKPKAVIDLEPILKVSPPSPAVLRDVKGYRGVLQEALFEIELPRRNYRILASSQSEAQDWMDVIHDVCGLDSDKTGPAIMLPQTNHRWEFECILLNKELKNPDVIIKFKDKSLQLLCPDTRTVLHDWLFCHLKSFGYLRNVGWFEAGPQCPTGSGMLCVSTPDAFLLFETFNTLAPKLLPGKLKRRLSRRHNMSWTSVATDSTDDPYETIPEIDLAASNQPKKVFGKLLSPEDLEPVAVAVPLQEHLTSNEQEFSFLCGETMRVLASKAFVSQGYWLGQKPRAPGFGLIPMKLVEVHEHEFGYMRDADDDKSVDSLLDNADTQAFEYPSNFGVYGASSTDVDDGGYEVPCRRSAVIKDSSLLLDDI